MSTSDDAGLVRQLYDAFNVRDFAAILAALAPDFEGVDMETGYQITGAEEFDAWLRKWVNAFPDVKITMACVIAEKGVVVVEHVAGGLHTGDLEIKSRGISLAPTGQRLEMRFTGVLEMQGGLIARMRIYWEAEKILRQLGLVIK